MKKTGFSAHVVTMPLFAGDQGLVEEGAGRRICYGREGGVGEVTVLRDVCRCACERRRAGYVFWRRLVYCCFNLFLIVVLELCTR